MKNAEHMLTAVLILLYLSSPDPQRTQEHKSVEQVAQAEKSSSSSALELSAETNKSMYRQGERIILEVKLINTSRQTVFVYGLLHRGPIGSLEVHVFDDKGNKVFPDVIAETFTVPPKDRTEFAILYPDHLLGIRSTEDTDYWNLNIPGKYKMIVEYHSPIPKGDALGLAIWPREKGSLFSKPIEIEVLPAE